MLLRVKEEDGIESMKFVELKELRQRQQQLEVSSVRGNEEADSLAKSGTTKDCLESMEERQSDLQSDTNVACGCAPRDHLPSVREIILEAKGVRTRYVGFLDLVKAYDSVYWTALFDILRQYGFGDHTLGLLRNYYLDQNFVRVKLGAPFQSGRGVRQGCLLSPLLFDIVLDWVFRRAKDQLTPICRGTTHRAGCLHSC